MAIAAPPHERAGPGEADEDAELELLGGAGRKAGRGSGEAAPAAEASENGDGGEEDDAFEAVYGARAGTLRPVLRLMRTHAHYRLVYLAQFVSWTGRFLTMTASTTLLLELADEASASTAVAALLVAMAVPHVLLSPLTGPLADRVNRYHIMLAADAFSAASLPLLALAVGRPGRVWLVYAVMFCVHSAQAFFEPARSAVRPLLLSDRRLFPLAGSADAMAFAVSVATGGAVAGLAVSRLGYVACFSMDAASYAISACLVLRAYMTGAPSYAPVDSAEAGDIELASAGDADVVDDDDSGDDDDAAAAAQDARPGALTMWRQGARYLAHEKRHVLAVMLIKCAENFSDGLMDTAVPRMAAAHFAFDGSPALTLGLVNVMGGLGTSVVAVVRAVDPQCDEPPRRRVWLARSLVAIAAGTSLMSWSPHVAVFFAGAFVWYGSAVVAHVAVVTITQLGTDDAMRGRVEALALLMRIASRVLGAFCYAALTDGAGLSVRQASWAAAAFPLVAAAATAWRYTPWRNRAELQEAAAADGDAKGE